MFKYPSEAKNQVVLAQYSPEMLRELKLPKDHNNRLKRKDLSGYDLRGMDLTECFLRGFTLVNAQLDGAILTEAQLQGANLIGAKGLEANQVKSSRGWPLATYSSQMLKQLGFPEDHNDNIGQNRKDLSGYPLQGVDFSFCDLTGFNLKGAKLQGANLKRAHGITRQQLRQAFLDHTTKLPHGFQELLSPPPSHRKSGARH